MTYKGSLNAAVFLLFLERLIVGASRKILLIADRLQAHKTPELLAWVEEHKERIELFFLPAYAPELNPVEYLNNDMKEQVNKGDCRTTGGACATGWWRSWITCRASQNMSSGCFMHPCVQYAAPIEI